MEITSFYFLLFLGIVLLLYYIVPKKIQWIVLLGISVVFFMLYGRPWLVIYPIVSIIVTYFGAIYIGNAQGQRQKKAVLSFVVVFHVMSLIIMKYLNFGIYTHNALLDVFHVDAAYWQSFHMLVPLGISFYTLSMIGYTCDVAWEITKPQKNFFRFALFGMYFPVMISGPIIRYKDMEKELYAVHYLDYRKLTFGMQRILWGFFKKLVISERFAIIASTVYGDYASYPGLYIFLGTLAFSFQLYADFSGCMDIVLGVSECFGIQAPENFTRPFFSRTMQEFWRRWHITLGAWLKDYIFYPLLRTSFFMGMPKKLKPKLGKKAAKQITTFLAMFILWFAIGLWHGGAWKYIIGSGILHWFYIVMGELLEPFWKKLRAFFHVNTASRGFIAFQRVRTFLLASSGFLFFHSGGMRKALAMYVSMFTNYNPQILWNGSLLQLGLDMRNLVIAVVSLMILFAVSCMQEKRQVREWLADRPLVVRWILLYALLFYVILLGNYGPGYSATEFIYAGF